MVFRRCRGGGSFNENRLFFNLLMKIGPSFGYHPEPTKSVLITGNLNSPQVLNIKNKYGFKISNGESYLGGFVGLNEKRRKWISKKIDK